MKGRRNRKKGRNKKKRQEYEKKAGVRKKDRNKKKQETDRNVGPCFFAGISGVPAVEMYGNASSVTVNRFVKCMTYGVKCRSKSEKTYGKMKKI